MEKNTNLYPNRRRILQVAGSLAAVSIASMPGKATATGDTSRLLEVSLAVVDSDNAGCYTPLSSHGVEGDELYLLNPSRAVEDMFRNEKTVVYSEQRRGIQYKTLGGPVFEQTGPKQLPSVGVEGSYPTGVKSLAEHFVYPKITLRNVEEGVQIRSGSKRTIANSGSQSSVILEGKSVRSPPARRGGKSRRETVDLRLTLRNYGVLNINKLTPNGN